MLYYYYDETMNKVFIDQNQILDKIIAIGFNPTTDNDDIIEIDLSSINQIKDHFKDDLEYLIMIVINNQKYFIYAGEWDDY